MYKRQAIHRETQEKDPSMEREEDGTANRNRKGGRLGIGNTQPIPESRGGPGKYPTGTQIEMVGTCAENARIKANT